MSPERGSEELPRALFPEVHGQRGTAPSWLQKEAPKRPALRAALEPRLSPREELQRLREEALQPQQELPSSPLGEPRPLAPSSPPPSLSDQALRDAMMAGELGFSSAAQAEAQNQELKLALEEVRHGLHDLRARRLIDLEGAEARLLELLAIIARKVLLRDLEKERGLAQRLIREGLTTLTEAEKLQIIVGPGWVEPGETFEEDLARDGIAAEVFLDETASPFALTLRSELGEVSEDVHQRLDLILGELLPEGDE